MDKNYLFLLFVFCTVSVWRKTIKLLFFLCLCCKLRTKNECFKYEDFLLFVFYTVLEKWKTNIVVVFLFSLFKMQQGKMKFANWKKLSFFILLFFILNWYKEKQIKLLFFLCSCYKLRTKNECFRYDFFLLLVFYTLYV
jgi:hypothetical protein